MIDLEVIAEDFIRGYIEDAASDLVGVLELNPGLSAFQAEDVIELVRHAQVTISWEN